MARVGNDTARLRRWGVETSLVGRLHECSLKVLVLVVGGRRSCFSQVSRGLGTARNASYPVWWPKQGRRLPYRGVSGSSSWSEAVMAPSVRSMWYPARGRLRGAPAGRPAPVRSLCGRLDHIMLGHATLHTRSPRGCWFAVHLHAGASLSVPSRPEEKALSSHEYFFRNCNRSVPVCRQALNSRPLVKPGMDTDRFCAVVKLHHELVDIVISLLLPPARQFRPRCLRWGVVSSGRTFNARTASGSSSLDNPANSKKPRTSSEVGSRTTILAVV